MSATASTLTRARWSDPGWLALLAMAAVTLALAPTAVQLVELWMDSDRPYSHGLLVGPLALLLILRVCLHTQPTVSPCSFRALILFAGAMLLWVVGYAIDVLAVQQMLFPALLLLGAWSMGGWRIARRLLFPVGFLYFAIPIWTALTPLLQTLTVGVVSSVLDVVGIPVYVEGNFITIPEGVFEVAGGCAGLHFFIVAITIASLHAYLSLDALGPRSLFVGVALGLAVLTNWIRVGSLVVIGHVTEMQHYLITQEHYYYGWILFAIALIPLFVLARRQTMAPVQGPTEASATAVLNVHRVGVPIRVSDWAVAGLFVLLLLPPLVIVSGRSGESQMVAFDLELPAGVDGWELVGPGDWAPDFVGADSRANVAYERGDRVGVYMAIYRTQSQGRELISNDNRLPPQGWRPRSAGSVAVEGIPGLSGVHERVVVSPAGAEHVIWSWYVVGSWMAANDLTAKLWQALGELRGRDSGAVVAISAACQGECAAARLLLQEFLLAMGEPLAATAAFQQGSASGVAHSVEPEDSLL